MVDADVGGIALDGLVAGVGAAYIPLALRGSRKQILRDDGVGRQ